MGEEEDESLKRAGAIALLFALCLGSTLTVQAQSTRPGTYILGAEWTTDPDLDFEYFAVESADHFSPEGGYATLDRDGRYEQLFHYNETLAGQLYGIDILGVPYESYLYVACR